jgi:hypothetical protein
MGYFFDIYTPYKMNPFDYVPLDILQFVLGPFLDQETMIAFNQVTDPRERIYRRFPKDYATKHHIRVLTIKWSTMLQKINRYQDEASWLKNDTTIVKLLNDQTVPVNLIIFMHYYRFREAVINKFTDNIRRFKHRIYSTDDIEGKIINDQYLNISERGLKVIEANKFVREINSKEFTPIVYKV